MKTTIKLLSLVSLFTIPSIFIACDESDGDNTAPLIELSSPQEGIELTIGSTIDFSAVFKDNEMLSSYRVNIHHNFDNHGHEHSRDVSDEDIKNAFSFNRKWDITGTEQTIQHQEIEIPTGVTPGKYHLVVECVDAAYNEAKVFRNIVLIK